MPAVPEQHAAREKTNFTPIHESILLIFLGFRPHFIFMFRHCQ